MKVVSKFSLLFLFSICFTSLFAIKTDAVKSYDLETISVDDYLGMKYKDFKKFSPEKLNISDRMNFVATKKYLKSKIKNGSITKDRDYSIAAGGFKFKFGAFIVGGIFGLLGLLLVVLLVKKPRKNAVISCVLGMVLWGAIIASLTI